MRHLVPTKPVTDAKNQMKRKKKKNLRRFPGIGSVLKHVRFDAREFAFSLENSQA